MQTAPHVFRSASKGKIFTRKERETLVSNERIQKGNKSALAEFIAIEKAKIEQEKAKRQLASRARAVLLQNPTLKKINQKKSGVLYYQLRTDGGKMGAVIIV